MATRQLVVFTVNNEEFGIDVSQVNIIERRMEVFKVPNTPDFVEGLINLRGSVYTVFSLRKRFGLPVTDHDDNTRFIMVNTSKAIIGIIADSVQEIIKVDDQDIEVAPSMLDGLKKRFVSSIAKTGSRIIMLLDIENVLPVEANS